MKVLILSNGDDNGGVGAALKFAFDRWIPEIEVRAVRQKDNFIRFAGDITVRDFAEVMPLYREADIVHFMDKASAVDWAPGWQGKRLLMHHHGLAFKAHTANGIVEFCRSHGIVQIAALPGLTQYAPKEIEWLPNPCDVEKMQKIREEVWRPSRRVRVGQTPAQRGPNATEIFLDAYRSVSNRADLILTERVDWETCLRQKAVADVGFDSFISGYGLAGMEYMAMGIPLISGSLDTYTERRIASEVGYLPYLSATASNLRLRLAEMVDTPQMRKDYALRGLDFSAKVHAEHRVAGRLAQIYQGMMEDRRG